MHIGLTVSLHIYICISCFLPYNIDWKEKLGDKLNGSGSVEECNTHYFVIVTVVLDSWFPEPDSLANWHCNINQVKSAPCWKNRCYTWEILFESLTWNQINFLHLKYL